MRDIKRIAVLGANGTMGAGASALFAGRGFEVAMLARTREKAEQGLAAAQQAVRSEAISKLVTCGSYESDLQAQVSRADLVLEAVSEDLKIKRAYFEQIDAFRRPGTVVCTISSGLSIADMVAGRSDDFRRHFLGMHLFNPPMVIVGTEVITGPDTDPEVFHSVATMLRKRLGRQVVECRDKPAFAGNRIGFKVLNECAQLAQQHGVALIDYLLGPYTGRAMPPLATIDLVGWDVHAAIVDNVHQNSSDEAHASFAMPAYMRALIAKGHLGNKTPKLGGFYRKIKDAAGKTSKLVLDPKTGLYSDLVAPVKIEFVEQMKALHRVGRHREALQVFLRAKGPEAQIARKVILGYVSYALHRVGPTEVVDAVDGADRIMAYGFNWAPPSVLVALWERDATVAAMRELNLPVPRVLAELKPGATPFTESMANAGRFFISK